MIPFNSIDSPFKVALKQQEQEDKGLQTPSLQQLLVVLSFVFFVDLQQLFSQFSFGLNE